MKEGLRLAAGKLTAPFLITMVVLFGFYLGGDSFQGFGLAAMDSTRRVLKYVLGVAAFLSLAVLVQRIVQYVIFDGLVASATGSPVPKLLSQISGLVIFGIAVSACAGIVFEQDLTVLWAASGVAGLVLGMALRELLQDVFAGIALNIDRAIRIGEYIQIHRSGDAKISGQVLEISWRTTRVRDFMGDLVIFPNSKFSAFTITNFSQPEANSFRFVTLTLDARVPLARATRILQAAALEAMTGLAGPDTPVPWVEVKAIRLEGIEYAIFYKAEWRHLANAAPMILQTVLTHLAFAGLETATVLTEGASASDGTAARTRAAGPDGAGLVALLGATALFRGVGEAPLRLLARHAALRERPAGQVAIQAGEAGTSLHLVLEGLLSADAGRRSVRDPLPATLRPGDLFDPAILRGEAHGSTVRCRTPVLLCEFGSEALQALFGGNPDAMERVARNLVAASPNRAGEEEERVADTLRQMRQLFPATTARPNPNPNPVSSPVSTMGPAANAG
ncbi:mechanosensitive ion channel family protein [Azospirillum sp. B510]|uniref:mechanosensitive ion channel family protein n=1 Tax=Azospirillum sp. (strain B510) TaxID=137722 RepID=UPI0003061759|nr:mechanosensitive ion channel family protein [Azospirillum sp. B510]